MTTDNLIIFAFLMFAIGYTVARIDKDIDNDNRN